MLPDSARLAAIEKDNEIRTQQIDLLFTKIDRFSEKVQDLTTTLSKIVAVHETRIESMVENINDISKTIETNRLDYLKDMRVINDKIDTNKKEVLNKIDELETKILAALVEDKKNNELKIEKIDKRLGEIERWKYAVVAGASIVGFFAKYILDWFAAQ